MDYEDIKNYIKTNFEIKIEKKIIKEIIDNVLSDEDKKKLENTTELNNEPIKKIISFYYLAKIIEKKEGKSIVDLIKNEKIKDIFNKIKIKYLYYKNKLDMYIPYIFEIAKLKLKNELEKEKINEILYNSWQNIDSDNYNHKEAINKLKQYITQEKMQLQTTQDPQQEIQEQQTTTQDPQQEIQEQQTATQEQQLQTTPKEKPIATQPTSEKSTFKFPKVELALPNILMANKNEESYIIKQNDFNILTKKNINFKIKPLDENKLKIEENIENNKVKLIPKEASELNIEIELAKDEHKKTLTHKIIIINDLTKIIPNAEVSKPYEFSFKNKDIGAGYTIHNIELENKIEGLQIDSFHKKITGIPKTEGEVPIKIKILVDGNPYPIEHSIKIEEKEKIINLEIKDTEEAEHNLEEQLKNYEISDENDFIEEIKKEIKGNISLKNKTLIIESGLKNKKPEDKEITFKIKNEKTKKEIEGKMIIKIWSHPDNMWENKEPEDSLFPKKNEEKNSITIDDNSFIIAASNRGKLHAHKALHRDDDYEIYYDEDTQWSIIIVADGAGSAKYSREGSRVACESAKNKAIEKLKEVDKELTELIQNKDKESLNQDQEDFREKLYSVLAGSINEAKNEVVKLPEKYKVEHKKKIDTDVSVKSFSTTILLGIHKKIDNKHFFGGFWIGDGGLVVVNKEALEGDINNADNNIFVLGKPDIGSYGGQTYFLNTPAVWKDDDFSARMRFEIIENFEGIFVAMTDGITDPKFETENNLNKLDKWKDFWKEIKPILKDNNTNEKKSDELLNWLDFHSKGNYDDRTIAILHIDNNKGVINND